MKFLADENFPAPTIAALAQLGHDIAQVERPDFGKPDKYVLSRAQTEGRVVLTCDKDFGELAFKHRLPAHCGIVLFRLVTKSLSEFTARVVMTLSVGEQWVGNFVVVKNTRIRVRPLTV